jgi:hypothetical protein
LKAISPDTSTSEIAQAYKISPEAVRRILKSKFRPEPKQLEQIVARWKRRGERLGAFNNHTKPDPSDSTNDRKISKRKKKKDLSTMFF